jgi:nucleoside 2-deoxyribosyltransferase
MKLCYVAGAYRGYGDFEVFHNIIAARTVAERLWKMGYPTICPHLNSQFMSGLTDEEVFIEGGKLMIEKCDMVVLVSPDSPEKSQGTKAEVNHAFDRGIPVMVFNKKGKLVPWRRKVDWMTRLIALCVVGLEEETE